MQFDDSVLPPRPTIVPDDMRTLVSDPGLGDWQQRVPAHAVGMFVAAVAQWLSDPRFGVSVRLATGERGWTISVELPAVPDRDDVTMPADAQQGAPAGS